MAKPLLSLLIEQGPKTGHCLQCRPRGRVTIGRARSNTLQIGRDAGISQKHLAFSCANSSEEDDIGWSITDLGSSNGTLLNDLQIEPNLPISIKAGDLIKIGSETTIRVVIPSTDLASSKATVLSDCSKGISQQAGSHAKGIPVLEAHHETHVHIFSAVQNYDKLAEEDLDMHDPLPEKDHSKHIPPSEENHYKHSLAPAEHHRARVSKDRGQEPEHDACKSSTQGIDLNMTVEQWFTQLLEQGPKYLYEVSESMIQDILLESKQYDEYVQSLNQGQ